MVQKLLNLKQDPEIVATPLCLGNISNYFSVDNMKKIVLNGYIYDFSVNYDGIAVADILNIHKYLMKKHDIKCLDFEKVFFTATTFFSCNVLM